MAADGWMRERLLDVADRVARAEDLVCAGDPEGVHDLRVALRTARSLVGTYGALLADADAAAAPALCDDLRWVGNELGAARDGEVLQEHLVALASAEPDDEELRHALALMDADAAERLADGHRRMQEVLGSARHRSTVDRFRDLASRAPGASPDQARALLADEWRRTRRRVDAAAGADAGDPAGVELLHRARKAAKRGRYAAEALVPELGEQPAAMAEVARAVQQALGEHRDAMLVRAALRRQAETGPEARFALGRLDAHEQVREEQALAEFSAVAPLLRKRRLRRWLPASGSHGAGHTGT